LHILFAPLTKRMYNTFVVEKATVIS